MKRKYFVKIDLDSIEKNKDAGKTISYFLRRQTIYFETNQELPDYFKDGENCYITEQCWTPDGQVKIRGVINSDELLRICEEKKPNIKYEFERDIDCIYHAPIPEYSYNFENIEIRCVTCNKRIFLSDLNFDCVEDNFSSTICPECSKWDCCELEYETIENALIRKNNHPIKMTELADKFRKA